MSYADRTRVEVESSRAEIERDLKKYGADAFGFTIDKTNATIAFRIRETYYRLSMIVPEGSQAARSRWRALALVIKAKLVAVQAGVETLEDAFLANMVMPDSQTVGEWIKPQMLEAHRIGVMPQRLMIEGPRP